MGAPGILHFKGLGMRNWQYEMRICQKSHNKVTKTAYVWFEFLFQTLDSGSNFTNNENDSF